MDVENDNKVWEWIATVPHSGATAIMWTSSIGNNRLAIAVPNGVARSHGELPVLEALALLCATHGHTVKLSSAGWHDNWIPGGSRMGFCTFFFDITEVS